MKKGLEYFPMDVDMFQDIRIRKLIKRQGGKAVSVYVLLLCIIYKDGYYMRWDEELPFIISEQTGFDEAYIQEVVNCCMALGLFDAALFQGQKVLTSKGIQERYMMIRKTMKRITIMDEFNVLSSEELHKTSEERGKTSEEMCKTSEFEQQSKVKKNKIKEKEDIKEKEIIAADAAPPTQNIENRKNIFYNSLVPFVDQYGAEMVREFFDYWSEFNRSKTKMRFEQQPTWEVGKRLATWARHDSKFGKRTEKTPNVNDLWK